MYENKCGIGLTLIRVPTIVKMEYFSYYPTEELGPNPEY